MRGGVGNLSCCSKQDWESFRDWLPYMYYYNYDCQYFLRLFFLLLMLSMTTHKEAYHPPGCTRHLLLPRRLLHGRGVQGSGFRFRNQGVGFREKRLGLSIHCLGLWRALGCKVSRGFVDGV